MFGKSSIKKSMAFIGTEGLVTSTPLLANSELLRNAFIFAMQKYISVSQTDYSKYGIPRPLGVDEDRSEFSKVIWKTADRILQHNLSRPVMRNVGRNLVNGIMVEGCALSAVEQFNELFGSNPPGFLTISPGKTCNLQCVGCYANAGIDSERLEWDVLDRIVTEAKTLWGIKFIVVSGGEPLAYRSRHKTILDIANKHPDVFFLMYTNGTLIDENMANQLAELGNITPAISVEGWQQRTDERRGVGVYEKILAAMNQLRKAGVPFGISLTATCNNVEEILSDEFIDFFFEKQGALYGWLFHYMPIGRSFTLDLMPTPEQRVWMWKRTWEIIRERHIFLADFWNHGTLSDGCLAAGRSEGGGYFYIDWNGAVSPCVFVPYSPMNINSIYESGGTLNDIWKDSFFSGIRNWQGDYRENKGNWLAPCINRDHHQVLDSLIGCNEPDPIDENAQKALLDPDYSHGLEDYGKAYRRLSDPLWEKHYLHLTPEDKPSNEN